MENIDEIKNKLECLRGLTFMGLDKIYFYEQSRITLKELEKELDACKNMLKTFIQELDETMSGDVKNGNNGIYS